MAMMLDDEKVVKLGYLKAVERVGWMEIRMVEEWALQMVASTAELLDKKMVVRMVESRVARKVVR